MENSFQTSFIPKKPITSSGVSKSKPATNLFMVFSVLILIVTGVASGGLYVYKNYLIKEKQILSASLEKVRDSFEKDTIDELELYDKRVSSAKQVLNGHIVLSPLFKLLGDLTIAGVQYTKFDHQTNDKGFFVKMSGIARDYRSIALQADVFNTAKGRSFKNVVFSNLTRNKNGYVTFDIDFIVDPELLSYQKNLLLEQTQLKLQPTTEDNSPATQDTSTTQSNQVAPAVSNPPETSLPANNSNQ